MAGGGGTRLWPESRKNTPKQVSAFFDGETLLQKTYKRLLHKFDKGDIWITTNISHYDSIKKQIPDLPENQYSVEPDKRDTAAAIGLATMILNTLDADSSMININSDAFIKDEESFINCIDSLELFLHKNPKCLAGIGITPKHPETGFGYIEKDTFLEEILGEKIYKVKRFVEKPDLPTAKQYLKSGKFLWNPTLFCWKTSYMLELFKTYAPAIYTGLMELKPYVGTPKFTKELARIYPQLEKISIDYAIFEKAPNMAILEADFGWNDVGSWSAIKEIQEKHPSDNVIKGNVLLLDSKNCLVYGYDKKIVAISGLQDMIVVDTKDALMICPKDRSQDVKQIVEELEKGQYYGVL